MSSSWYSFCLAFSKSASIVLYDRHEFPNRQDRNIFTLTKCSCPTVFSSENLPPGRLLLHDMHPLVRPNPSKRLYLTLVFGNGGQEFVVTIVLVTLGTGLGRAGTAIGNAYKIHETIRNLGGLNSLSSASRYVDKSESREEERSLRCSLLYVSRYPLASHFISTIRYLLPSDRFGKILFKQLYIVQHILSYLVPILMTVVEAMMTLTNLDTISGVHTPTLSSGLGAVSHMKISLES